MTQDEFNIYKATVEHMFKLEKSKDYNILLLNMNLRMVMENKPLITDVVENAINKARAVN